MPFDSNSLGLTAQLPCHPNQPTHLDRATHYNIDAITSPYINYPPASSIKRINQCPSVTCSIKSPLIAPAVSLGRPKRSGLSVLGNWLSSLLWTSFPHSKYSRFVFLNPSAMPFDSNALGLAAQLPYHPN